MPENQGESVKSPIPDTEKRKNQAQATQLLLNSFDDDSEDEVWDALVNVETSLRQQNKGQADSAHSRDVDDSKRNTSIIAGWEMTDHSILFHYKKTVKTKRSLPEEVDYFFPVVGGEENDSEAILFHIGDEILASLVRRNKAGRLTLNKFRTILEMADAVIGNRVSFREIKPSTYQVLIVN